MVAQSSTSVAFHVPRPISRTITIVGMAGVAALVLTPDCPSGAQRAALATIAGEGDWEKF